jgi:hypothetical protein
VGGLSFWLPAIAISAVRENMNMFALNLIPLIGITLLGVANWMATKHPPKWGSVLAGIYILGPTAMMAPSLFIRTSSSADIPGEHIWMLLLCLFPPMTLWMATLNGMIFSVLITTVTLPFLIKHRTP